MATVIDSLVVTLGLDPKKFTQGQREALEQYKRTVEEAKRRSNDLEETARRNSQNFAKIRNEAIGLFGALAGAAGIKQFVANLVTGDVALANLARQTGISASELSKWQRAAEIVGGDAKEMGAAIAGLQNRMIGLSKGIVDENLIATYRALANETGVVVDVQADALVQMKQLAAALEIVEKRQKGAGAFWLGRIGAGGAEPLLNRGLKTLNDTLEAMKKIGHATDEDTKKAQDFWAIWSKTSNLVIDSLRKSFYEMATQDLVDVQKLFTGNWRAQLPFNERFGNFGSSPAGGFAAKSDAGKFSDRTMALANFVSGLPGFKQVTAANDAHHGGAGAHGEDRAIDFTLNDPSKTAEFIADLRQRFAALNIPANIIDASTPDSPKWTGPHIHVSLPSGRAGTDAAQRLQQQINIGTVNINAPAGADGGTIANKFLDALNARAQRMRDAMPANGISGVGAP